MLKNFFQRIFKKTNNFVGSQYNSFSKYINTWNMSKFLSVYQRSAYVYAAVKKRAEKVGQIVFTLHNKIGDKEITDSKVLQLLNKPNHDQTGSEFWELYQTYKDLAGIVYIWILESPLNNIQELHLLRPDWIKKQVVDENTGLVVAYDYQTPMGKSIMIPAEDMIVSRYPNPLQQRAGLSPIMPASLSIDTEQQLSEYHVNVLKNGGKIEGIFNFETDNLTEDQIAEIKKMLEEQYSGARQAGKPLLTYGKMTYQNLGLTPTELSFLDSKEMTRNDILLIYGVSKVLLAQTDNVNFASAKVAKEIFLSETIKPLYDSLTDKLNESRLVPDNEKLGFIDPTPQDVELKIKTAEAGIQNYYMTPDEARALFGLEPIKGGDKLYIPFNVIAKEATAKNENTKKVKKKLKNKVNKSDFKHPLKNPEVRKLYEEAWLKQEDRHEEIFIKALRKYLDGQRKRMTDSLSSGLEVKNIIDDVFTPSLEVSIGKEELLPILSELSLESGQQTSDILGLGITYQNTPNVQAFLSQKADVFLNEITETTFEQLQRQLQESIDLGEGRNQLVSRIDSLYERISAGRAKTIARTEVVGVTQNAKFEVYKQAALPIKIWITVGDGKVRDSHSSIDEQERPVNDTFSNGLRFPGDPQGSAGEVINCRCTI